MFLLYSMAAARSFSIWLYHSRPQRYWLTFKIYIFFFPSFLQKHWQLPWLINARFRFRQVGKVVTLCVHFPWWWFVYHKPHSQWPVNRFKYWWSILVVYCFNKKQKNRNSTTIQATKSEPPWRTSQPTLSAASVGSPICNYSTNGAF